MLDLYRRRTLTRLVLDNELTALDLDFMSRASVLVAPDVTTDVIGTLNLGEKSLVDLDKPILAIKAMRERYQAMGLPIEERNLPTIKGYVDTYRDSEECRKARILQSGY